MRSAIGFGLCGGLDSALRGGDVVIGARVLSGGAGVMVDESVARELAARLRAAGERVSLDAVAGVEAPVLTRAAKAELRKATMAASVDTGSAIAARPSPSRASSAIPPTANCRLS